MRTLWLFLALGLIVIWLFFPTIFNWWALNIWNVPNSQIDEIGKLGAIGDIYGSLNTLISSIALCAVAFSTWLQVTSLKENREANQRQLELAEHSHQEQLKETKYSIFSNMFYALMNEKQQRSKSVNFIKDNENKNSIEVFEIINFELYKLVENDWNDTTKINQATLRKVFDDIVRKYNKYDQAPNLYTYFLIYGDILNLINKSDIDIEDKEFFKRVLRNSMLVSEQLTLFWLSAFTPDLKLFLKDSKLFDYFYSENLTSFAFKFHEKSHFNQYKFIEVWPKDK